MYVQREREKANVANFVMVDASRCERCRVSIVLFFQLFCVFKIFQNRKF